MDKPELRTVARPGSIPPERVPEPKRASTASWRTISLLATPLVLGLINLVDAYADKQKAVIAGDKHYARLVGEGEESKRLAIEEGMSVGQKKKTGILNEARSHSAEIFVGARGRADEITRQGGLAAPVIELQAEATIAKMRPLHDITENLLQITRLALLNQEEIEISIDKDTLSNVRFVGRRESTNAERVESLRRATRDAPRLTGIAMSARFRLDASSTRRAPVCDP